jgi:hypothetical protein
MNPTPCVISVADHAGWAHVVCVAAVDQVPAVVDRRRVTLIAPGLPTMPYHHESLELTIDHADALIARVRRSIAQSASRALDEVITALAPAYSVVALVIRESPFPELPDSVAAVRPSYQLQCAADGMMYTLAICAAAADLGLDVERCARGEEAACAAGRLQVDARDVELFVDVTGRPTGPPWTVEHRRAFSAGIAALAARASTRLAIPAQ